MLAHLPLIVILMMPDHQLRQYRVFGWRMGSILPQVCIGSFYSSGCKSGCKSGLCCPSCPVESVQLWVAIEHTGTLTASMISSPSSKLFEVSHAAQI